MAKPVLKTLTFDEVEALEDRDGLRYELWNGQAFAMTGGTSAHNQIALDLRELIKRQMNRGCLVYAADMALKLGSGAYTDRAYPDVMTVCDPLPGTYQTEPVLVAEVLSESSVTRDRNEKLRAYTALDSVQVYLIVSQTAVEIEVYRRATRWTREIYRDSDVVELDAPKLALPLREVYESIWDQLTSNA